MASKITVLIVDDSALMRKELSAIINADPQLRVVGMAPDGREGLEMAKDLEPDVVTLDVNLPGMDGITCLQHIMIETPRPCLMVSAYTGDDSVDTFEALELGAVDFVEKPSGEISRDIGTRGREITRKIRGAAGANVSAITRDLASPVAGGRPKARVAGSRPPDRVVVIGVSTGGPRTLMRIIPFLPPDLGAPVLVIQHMPGRFTGGMAERLDQHSLLTVKEAENGEPLRNNVVYVAPGDTHLVLMRTPEGTFVTLARPSAEDLIAPSVDRALGSAIDAFGKAAVGVILTGMGDDGARAMQRLHELGGRTIAESEETAIVFGMPAAAIARGAARVVAPADDIADRIVRAVRG